MDPRPTLPTGAACQTFPNHTREHTADFSSRLHSCFHLLDSSGIQGLQNVHKIHKACVYIFKNENLKKLSKQVSVTSEFIPWNIPKLVISFLLYVSTGCPVFSSVSVLRWRIHCRVLSIMISRLSNQHLTSTHASPSIFSVVNLFWAPLHGGIMSTLVVSTCLHRITRNFFLWKTILK